MPSDHPRSIAVDLDGVILTYDHWRGVHHFGDPMPGVVDALNALMAKGYNVIINTVRTNTEANRLPLGELVSILENGLKDKGIPYTSIWSKPGKPLASYYIDDKAIKFSSWDKALQDVAEKDAASHGNL